MRILAIVISLLFIALSVNGQGNTSDSLKILLQQKQPDTLRALRLLDLSYTYVESAPDTMLLLSSEALDLSRKVDFRRGEALSLNRQGIAYRQMGNLTKAMELTLKGMRISETINDPEGLRKAYTSLGNFHSGQPGEESQALEYHLKAKTLADKMNDKGVLSIVLANIGSSYSRLKKYDSAKLFTQQAFDRAAELSSARMMGVPMLIMGSIYRSTNQLPLALEAYRAGANYSRQAGDDYHLIDDYIGMASVFNLQNQEDSSLYYAKLALSTAQRKGFLLNVPSASDLIYTVYKSRGNKDSALFYLEITRRANDSLYNQENIKKLQGMNMEERLRQQEKQQEEAKAKVERAHNLQYAAIAIGLVTFLILFLLLSHTVVVSQTLIKILGVIALLVLFEFINLLIHPYLGEVTHHSPFFMLLIMVCIAALLVPLHHKIEHWIIHRLVEKNNRIRLAAAKRTIQQLEGGKDTVVVNTEAGTEQKH